MRMAGRTLEPIKITPFWLVRRNSLLDVGELVQIHSSPFLQVRVVVLQMYRKAQRSRVATIQLCFLMEKTVPTRILVSPSISLNIECRAEDGFLQPTHKA